MNTDRIENAPSTTPDHGSFYIPWFDPEPTKYFIDQTTPTIEEILDFAYVPPSPVDPIALARAHDPRKIYHDKVRKITMESLTENGRIVGGPHRLPPKPILFLDVEARERALRTDGTQYDGPSGTVSWYYHADMTLPRPVVPASNVIRSQDSLPAGAAGERIGVDPLKTIGGGATPAWRGKEETQSKKRDKRFDPTQKNKKKAGPKKHKEN